MNQIAFGGFALAYAVLCVAAAAMLADGNPQRRPSNEFLVADPAICDDSRCSEVFIVSASQVVDTAGPDFPPGSRVIGTVPGSVRHMEYASDGMLRLVVYRFDDTQWPPVDEHLELWEMNGDGTDLRRLAGDFAYDPSDIHRGDLAKLLGIPKVYDTNSDGGEFQPPLYVALTSPDGRLVVSRVTGIDSHNFCVSTASDWDPSFRTAACFGDGHYSLPVWVAH